MLTTLERYVMLGMMEVTPPGREPQVRALKVQGRQSIRRSVGKLRHWGSKEAQGEGSQRRRISTQTVRGKASKTPMPKSMKEFFDREDTGPLHPCAKCSKSEEECECGEDGCKDSPFRLIERYRSAHRSARSC